MAAALAGGQTPATSVAEVPPQGYLEVESRNSPTSPRALRTLARTAARGGPFLESRQHAARAAPCRGARAGSAGVPGPT